MGDVVKALFLDTFCTAISRPTKKAWFQDHNKLPPKFNFVPQNKDALISIAQIVFMHATNVDGCSLLRFQIAC